MGGMPSEPDRLSGADPGLDPEPPSELEEGPAMSVTACPSGRLSTDLQHEQHFFRHQARLNSEHAEYEAAPGGWPLSTLDAIGHSCEHKRV